MDDRERFEALYRRIEAHRWVILGLVSALNDRGALDVRSFVADLRKLESEMRKGNEADGIIGEVGEMARLLGALDPA